MKDNAFIVMGILLLILVLSVFVIFAILDIKLSNIVVSVSLLCVNLFTLISLIYYDSKGSLIRAFEEEKLELYILLITGTVVPFAMLCDAFGKMS